MNIAPEYCIDMELNDYFDNLVRPLHVMVDGMDDTSYNNFGVILYYIAQTIEARLEEVAHHIKQRHGPITLNIHRMSTARPGKVVGLSA